MDAGHFVRPLSCLSVSTEKGEKEAWTRVKNERNGTEVRDKRREKTKKHK